MSIKKVQMSDEDLHLTIIPRYLETQMSISDQKTIDKANKRKPSFVIKKSSPFVKNFDKSG
jgi:hypothetical protein